MFLASDERRDMGLGKTWDQGRHGTREDMGPTGNQREDRLAANERRQGRR